MTTFVSSQGRPSSPTFSSSFSLSSSYCWCSRYKQGALFFLAYACSFLFFIVRQYTSGRSDVVINSTILQQQQHAALLRSGFIMPIENNKSKTILSTMTALQEKVLPNRTAGGTVMQVPTVPSHQSKNETESKGNTPATILRKNHKNHHSKNIKMSSSMALDAQNDAMTFGHSKLVEEDPLFLFAIPDGVDSNHLYRYRSNGIFWSDATDAIYLKYQSVITRKLQTRPRDFTLPEKIQDYQDKLQKQLVAAGLDQKPVGAIVPATVRAYQHNISSTLKLAGLDTLAKLFDNAFPFTLEQTTFPLFDGTTYIITGDIELMWHRDSCAQINPYLILLDQSQELEALVEGLLRRQSLFILTDPYATSFRLFLDFDFTEKRALTDWDYKCGRTIHVAMHDYELDNLAYHLRLAYKLFQHYQQRNKKAAGGSTAGYSWGVLDDTWLRGFTLILDTVEREQNHEKSDYVYEIYPNGGKGTKICQGGGLSWVGSRPSDDATTYGYLIPSNMMMIVSLQQAAEILRTITGNDQDLQARRAERLAVSMDQGIHKHGVVNHTKFGLVYAYEVDGCGGVMEMDDANIPSLLSIPYLGYHSPDHDPTGQIARNTRNLVLSKANPFFYKSSDGCNHGIGSPHTPRNNVWHMAVTMQAMTTKTNFHGDTELRDLIEMLLRSATNNLMHESFNVENPTSFTRTSFAWANSIFAELIITRLDDIIRVMTNETFMVRDNKGKQC